MFEIRGLEKLTRDLSDAQTALAAVDGELGSVKFDPNDPASIETAIQQVGMLVDEKLGDYATNPIIGPLIEKMKEKYRDAIVNRGATARLESKNND